VTSCRTTGSARSGGDSLPLPRCRHALGVEADDSDLDHGVLLGHQDRHYAGRGPYHSGFAIADVVSYRSVVVAAFIVSIFETY
jgi:hypothetical protein